MFILFPDETLSTKKTIKKNLIKIKNYKLLGGQNIGLNALSSELNPLGYSFKKENHGRESRLIIKNKVVYLRRVCPPCQ